MKKFGAIILTFLLCSLMSVSSEAEEKLNVAVSILPQKYFVEKIGGSYVSVTVVVPRGASPATYEPKPSQMTKLSKCSIWFAIGVPFERAHMQRMASSIPSLKVVHTEKTVKLYPMENANEKEAAYKENHLQNYDPHIWLSPPDVMLQARTIAQELSRLDSLHENVYIDNYIRFVAELADLDRIIAKTLLNCKSRAFLTFHPSWGYFARSYDLKQIPVEFEGKEPSPKEMAKIIELAKSHKISTIFIQPQFSRTAAETVAKTIGAHVEELDPLAEDWNYNLRKVATTLRKALN